MKNFSIVLTAIFVVFMSSCTKAQDSAEAKTELTAAEFTKEIQDKPEAQLLDVRTHSEFASGHLANAKNIDWNGSNFETEIAELDKEKPVLIYCQSGRRSDAAADKMRDLGFKNVLELDGGINSWNAAGMPVTN